MCRQKTFRTLLCAALAAAIAFAQPLSVFAETLQELREEQDALEQKAEENGLLLEELQAETERREAYRDRLYSQIDTVQSQLDLLRRQIDALNGQIREAGDRVSEKEESLGRNMDLLKERIRALYVTGDASSLALILGSEDLMDFTEKLQVLKAVTRHDRELIQKLTTQLEELRDDRNQIAARKAELSEDRKALDAKSAELTQLYEEAQRLVDESKNDQWNAQADSELIDAHLEENEAAIAQLEEELRQQGSWVSGGGMVGTGSLIWPMPGYTYLTCHFGEGGHRGIDIAGGGIYGKPIVAADGGTVAYAGWNDSYGYCVFINHGNGYETRYAHMSALGCQTGSSVEQGQVIGYVGSTGNSTGPHLHFEVICGGSLTNPLNYF